MATSIHRTEDGNFEVLFDEDAIQTTLTDSGAVVDSWLDEIQRIHRRRLNRLVVVIDVEWRLSTSVGAGPTGYPARKGEELV